MKSVVACASAPRRCDEDWPDHFRPRLPSKPYCYTLLGCYHTLLPHMIWRSASTSEAGHDRTEFIDVYERLA